MAALLACGLVIAAGFVYAGGRHFAALRLGYQIQKLRTELDDAREQQQRLQLEREAAASPVRLERAARQLGMQPMLPSQIEHPKSASEKTQPVTAARDERTTMVQIDRKGGEQSSPEKKTR